MPRRLPNLRALTPAAAGRSLLLASAALLSCAAASVWAQDFELTEEQFNMWMTNGRQSATQQIQSQLEVEIRSLNQVCRLTPDQKEKLELAGQGDIGRFEDRVAALREKLVGKTYGQNEINDVFQQIAPLQQEWRAGVLGEGSLFNKVVRQTLKDAQREDFDRLRTERAEFRYKAKVKLYVATLERAIPMRAQQRQDLLDLLLATPPPNRFGEYDWYYVMYQASQVPKEKLKAIFDKSQLAALDKPLRQAAGYGNMLSGQGIKPVETRPANANHKEEDAGQKKKDAKPKQAAKQEKPPEKDKS